MQKILLMVVAVVLVGCGTTSTFDRAEAGDPIAQYDLGMMYLDGDGVGKDSKEAVKWFRKAADQGNALSQNYLGFMCRDGKGVLANHVAAYAWINIAVTNGKQDAKEDLLDLAKKMTSEQIAKAQELSKEMIKKNPKLIKEWKN